MGHRGGSDSRGRPPRGGRAVQGGQQPAIARDAETAARALGGLVNQGQLEAAQIFLDRLRQGISRSAAVAAAAERLRMRTAEEDLPRAGNLSKDLKDLE